MTSVITASSPGGRDGGPHQRRAEPITRRNNRLVMTSGVFCVVVAMFGLWLLVVVQLVLFPSLVNVSKNNKTTTTLSSMLLAPQSSFQQSPQQLEHQPGRRRKRRRRRNDDHKRPSDGTFNGAPLYKKTETGIESHVHCVGENYRPDAWKQRSCRFSFLCLDVVTKQFQLFQSRVENRLSNYTAQRPFMHTSSTLLRSTNQSNSVSIGGINLQWGQREKDGINRLQWFPKIIPINSTTLITYYELPEHVILLPFHSINGANPGHFVWDDLLPLYTLLSMFQLLDDNDDDDDDNYYDVLLLRYVLTDGGPGLWASCDAREEKTKQCNHIMNKFLPLFTGTNYSYRFSTTQDFEFTPTDNTYGTNLVCSRTSLAGSGSLTDHGLLKAHGWTEDDYLYTHNHGRGALLYDFRNFVMKNMDLHARVVPTSAPHRVVFSQHSSNIKPRSLDFERQMALVKERVPNTLVEAYVFANVTLHRQIEVVQDAAVFVTFCGGGAVNAMFLPKGATVIIIYSQGGGVKKGRSTGTPALLDWDLLNAMSHLRVHWMPRYSMKTELDEDIFTSLLNHEISLIESGAFA